MEKFLFACIIICHLLFELKITCSSPRPTSTCVFYIAHELMSKNKKASYFKREKNMSTYPSISFCSHTLLALYCIPTQSKKILWDAYSFILNLMYICKFYIFKLNQSYINKL